MMDENGVDFLNMRLVVVLIAAALLLSVAAAGVKQYLDWSSRDRARQETGRIAALARAEYFAGCPGSGSREPLAVTVPACVRRIVFGRAPGDGTENRNTRAYFIEFTDGDIDTFVSDCPFGYGDGASGGFRDAGVALYPGEYALELETTDDGGTYAVAIYGGAKC